MYFEMGLNRMPLRSGFPHGQGWREDSKEDGVVVAETAHDHPAGEASKGLIPTRGELWAESWPRATIEADREHETTAIAELPSRFIADMSRDELIRIICGAQLPWLDARTLRRFPFLDRPALERLAHLARRCCRNRLVRAKDVPEREVSSKPTQGR
jgi:hypothetical protein